MMGRWVLEMRLCRHLRRDHQNIFYISMSGPVRMHI
jgi:hypothetical protein